MVKIGRYASKKLCRNHASIQIMQEYASETAICKGKLQNGKIKADP